MNTTKQTGDIQAVCRVMRDAKETQKIVIPMQAEAPNAYENMREQTMMRERSNDKARARTGKILKAYAVLYRAVMEAASNGNVRCKAAALEVAIITK